MSWKVSSNIPNYIDVKNRKQGTWGRGFDCLTGWGPY